MKKLALILLAFLPAFAVAGGPLFKHKDSKVDQEFNQVYHDIKNAGGAAGAGDITSVSAGNGLTGGGASGAVSLAVTAPTCNPVTQKTNWNGTAFTCDTDQTGGGSGGAGMLINPSTTTATFPYAVYASSVNISSNTILSNATFYANGPVRLGRGYNQGHESVVIKADNTYDALRFDGDLVAGNYIRLGFYIGGPVSLSRIGGIEVSNTISGNHVAGFSIQDALDNPLLTVDTLSTRKTYIKYGGLVSNYGIVGSTLTISSNTVLSGATFYSDGPAFISSATVSVLDASSASIRGPLSVWGNNDNTGNIFLRNAASIAYGTEAPGSILELRGGASDPAALALLTHSGGNALSVSGSANAAAATFSNNNVGTSGFAIRATQIGGGSAAGSFGVDQSTAVSGSATSGTGAYFTSSGGTALETGAGSVRFNTLSASQFVKTDASENLVSYDLINGTQTLTGSNVFTSTAGIQSKAIANQCATWDAYGNLTGSGGACGGAPAGGGAGMLINPSTTTATFPYAVYGSSISISSNAILGQTTHYADGTIGGTQVFVSSIEAQGGLYVHGNVKTGDYYMTGRDSVIFASATNNWSQLNINIRLPVSSDTASQTVYITKVDVSTAIVTILARANDLIAGTTGAWRLYSPGQGIELTSDGVGGWHPIGPWQMQPAIIGDQNDPNAAAAVNAANQIYCKQTQVQMPVTITSMSYIVGGSAGTTDIGIYDNSGKLLSSRGNVATGAAGVRGYRLNPVLYLSPGYYWMCMGGSTTTTLTYTRPTIDVTTGQCTFTSSLPLPATLTFAGCTIPNRMFTMTGWVYGAATQ